MRVVSGIDKRSLDWPRCEGESGDAANLLI